MVNQHGERVASLSVSISALEALQWVKRDVADSTTITVGAGALTLTKEYLEHNTATLGKHPLLFVVSCRARRRRGASAVRAGSSGAPSTLG